MECKQKFVIVSPRQSSGGGIVLHILCEELIKKGYDAKIFFTQAYPRPKEAKFHFWLRWFKHCVIDTVKLALAAVLPKRILEKGAAFNGYHYKVCKNYRRKYLPWVDDKTIVIYPDVVYGNFLKAKKVVRWFLHYNRYDDSAYEPTDHFFAYKELFNDQHLNPENKILKLTFYDSDTFCQKNFDKRKGRCYIIRKGSKRSDIPTHFKGPIIDDYSEEEKARAFNQYKYCVFYDLETGYTWLAAVCGCIPVLMIPEDSSKDEFVKTKRIVKGVACGVSKTEIRSAVENRNNIFVMTEENKNKNKKSMEYFIDYCKKNF